MKICTLEGWWEPKVKPSRFEVWGLVVKVWGFRFSGFGFMFQGSGARVWAGRGRGDCTPHRTPGSFEGFGVYGVWGERERERERERAQK